MDLQQINDFASTKRLLPLLLSVTSLIYPKKPNLFFLYLKVCLTLWISRKMRSLITCVPVPDEIFIRLIPETLKCLYNSVAFDHCVLVNKDLVSGFNESSRKTYFMPITLHNNAPSALQTPPSTPHCYVEIIATEDLPHSQVLLSETTYLNLKESLKKSLKMSSTRHMFFKINEINKGLYIELQYASKVVVSLIQTPQEVHQELVKDCLSNYFEKARLLTVHSIFVINVSQYVPEANYTTGLENICYLYFKVQELEGPQYDNILNATETVGYLVAKKETTLLQNKTQGFIPSSDFFCKPLPDLSVRNFKNKLLPRCPPCLDALNSSIIKSFEPFLKIAKTPKSVSIKPVFWLVGAAGSGKQILLSSIAAHFGMHLWNFNCDEVFGKVSGQIEGKLKALFAKARTVTPCLLVISDIQLLCKNAEGQDDLRVISLFGDLVMEEAQFPLIVVATSSNKASVSPLMARIFLQTFVVPNQNEINRRNQLSWFNRLLGANASDDCLNYVSSRCSGFLYSDLEALVGHAIRNTNKRNKISRNTDMDMHLTREDFEVALDQLQSAYSDAIGAPKIPSVSWQDVGGLTEVKDEVLRTVNTPLHHPELVALGLRRSGVLLYGPPGTGKTLIAKAVATECSLNFLSVKGPELLNMYVGQTEENVREVFERARAASPCIIFFDELDSLAPDRGRSGDSGGVMDRVVSQLLAEMDGLQKSTHLFVIGATNRPDLIDPALLRPGRFDKLLYVNACEDHLSIACVMRALTRKFKLDEEVDVENLTKSMPTQITGADIYAVCSNERFSLSVYFRFKLGEEVDVENLTKSMPTQVTGADIYAVCSNAWRNAVRRAVIHSTSGSRNSNVEVKKEDFIAAISAMTPSVSAEDMKYFKNLQEELLGNKKYRLAD